VQVPGKRFVCRGVALEDAGHRPDVVVLRHRRDVVEEQEIAWRAAFAPALPGKGEFRQDGEEREDQGRQEKAGERDRARPQPSLVEVGETEAEEDRRDGDHDVRLEVRLGAERDQLLVHVPEDVVGRRAPLNGVERPIRRPVRNRRHIVGCRTVGDGGRT
jgi:hypothetical protein